MIGIITRSRVVAKAIRDFIVGNTIGQALAVIALVISAFLPVASQIGIEPKTLLLGSAYVTAANAIWRFAREQIAALGSVDPIARPAPEPPPAP